jgi:hypothetical protein
MNRSNSIFSAIIVVSLIVFFTLTAFFLEAAPENSSDISASFQEFILGTEDYHDAEFGSIKKQLLHRIEVQPFNAIAFLIFVIAIIHTFFARKITHLSHKLKNHYKGQNPTPLQLFFVEFLFFMGEVEVILGIWVIPLLIAMTYFFNWDTAIHYLNGISYSEPLFVVVVMALASTNPILKFAEDCLDRIAKIGNSSVQSYWWTLLTVGPLLGSFITEAASMTICALLLAKRFYALKPTPKFAYATLGLLFTNISVGGVLTNYAAPPVLMVVKAWDYTNSYMFKNFGLKAIAGILISNLLYYIIFRSEFKTMQKNRNNLKNENQTENAIPAWVTISHLLFLSWMVIHLHYPVIFIGSFLIYLGFYKATLPFQNTLELQTPILVGFFLSGLIIHGHLQEWWLGPILQDVSKEFLMSIALVLTAFNDNAQITFLASLIPNFDASMKYAIMAGAITGGGLTIIANAPNLVGQSFLKNYFSGGISALRLFLGAITPTIIIALIFYLFQPAI